MTENTIDYLDTSTPESCGCEENARASRLSRRSILAGLGGLGAAAGVSQLFGTGVATQYAYAGAGYDGDTVVVLSLRGGFDGLSAVAPVGDPNYAKLRPNIGVPASRALKLDSTFGLHPALGPLKTMWDNGQLSVIHAMGQSNPTRSHFAAMETMENAAPDSSLRTGWLDRMIGLTDQTPFGSVALGVADSPRSMVGPNPDLTMRSLETFKLQGVNNDSDLALWAPTLQGLHDGAPRTYLDTMNSALAALSTSMKIQSASYTPSNGAVYPGGDLGNALRDVARIIKAGVGLRAATIDVGDWDMHANLGRSDGGWMFTKLTELGNALGAFVTDLGPKLNDTTLVTMSEFGRRVQENGSGGLDHGHGNCSFVIGGGVTGGKVFGKWDGLGADALVQGDLPANTDYRLVLAEILEKRAKLNSAEVFPGLGSERLGVFRARG